MHNRQPVVTGTWSKGSIGKRRVQLIRRNNVAGRLNISKFETTYLLLVLTKIAAIKAHEYEIFATKEFSFSLSLLTERENNRIKFVSNNNL